MKSSLQELVLGIPISSAAYKVDRSPIMGYLPDPAIQCNIPSLKGSADTVLNRKNKSGKNGASFALGVREHGATISDKNNINQILISFSSCETAVRIGPKITETVKGKLSLGARILKVGGVEKIFKRFFSVREGEKLLKASQCYLSTTAGPIAGLLFISTDKIAFCSERSIKISSPNGEMKRIHYKVMIPLKKIERVNQSENVKKPSEKYMEVVTVDNFDFWFMGFLNYQKAFKYLQEAISQA